MSCMAAQRSMRAPYERAPYARGEYGRGPYEGDPYGCLAWRQSGAGGTVKLESSHTRFPTSLDENR